MIVIGGSSHPKMAEKIAEILGCDCVLAETNRFSDQELKTHIKNEIAHKHVLIVQSTHTPSDSHLMELLLLAAAAKHANSQHITAITPYFGYARQDLSAELILKLMASSGINNLVTLDLHSLDIVNEHLALHNVCPSTLFLNEWRISKNHIFIAPDNGAVKRTKEIASLCGADVKIIAKTRDSNNQVHMPANLAGIKGKHCIIIDDIIDSGQTISHAARLLHKSGAYKVSACITHAVASKNCLPHLSPDTFDRVLITDSIPHQSLPPFIEVIPVAPLLCSVIQTP